MRYASHSASRASYRQEYREWKRCHIDKVNWTEKMEVHRVE